jgi:hypothetical protein
LVDDGDICAFASDAAGGVEFGADFGADVPVWATTRAEHKRTSARAQNLRKFNVPPDMKGKKLMLAQGS